MKFKKRINGSWVDIPHYIHNTDTDTFTAFPTVLYPTGTTATVGLKGQTVQSGTPTPDNPIMPEGTGERTGNLVNFPVYRRDGDSPVSKIYPIYLPENTYTLSCDVLIHEGSGIGSAGAMYITVNGTKRYIIPNNSSIDNFTRYSITYTGEITEVGFIGYNHHAANPNSYVIIKNTQINLGSTALPYEPYGYKIPISSANTTTPVYIGEVESTRKIKKLVLTGEEQWDKISGNAPYRVEIPNIVRTSDKDIVLFTSSHYRALSNNASSVQSPNYVSWTFSDGVSGKFLVFRDTNQATLADFKTYLAQQYSAGTPVTVWYVLSTERTGVVNEPLMKIGDYADEVANASIPVTAGGDTLSVDTTVQPSEVTVNYKGWHDTMVKQFNGTTWE